MRLTGREQVELGVAPDVVDVPEVTDRLDPAAVNPEFDEVAGPRVPGSRKTARTSRPSSHAGTRCQSAFKP